MGKIDILWWIKNIEDSFCPIQLQTVYFIKNRCFESKLGRIFDKETTGGEFALNKSLLHTNALELKTVFFRLASLCSIYVVY